LSNPDSFIDEVTEEVRRDRLFATFRKYGWIGGLVVLAIVGGAAWNEWQKSQAAARAQGFGDALTEALDLSNPEERTAALAEIASDGSQTGILQLMRASDPETDKAAALAALDALAADASQPQPYRDLAVLRRVIVAGADMPLADRRMALDGLAVPGRPFRTLALEQLAYLLIEEAKTDEAIAALTALSQDQEAPAGLKSRARQVIVALGGTVDTPAPEAPKTEVIDAG
jgi:hypothetical protein